MQAIEAKKMKNAAEDPRALLKKVLTKRELEHIKFSRFRRGVLSINVDSSVWLYKLSLKKEGLLTKLKKKAGDMKDIRFCLG